MKYSEIKLLYKIVKDYIKDATNEYIEHSKELCYDFNDVDIEKYLVIPQIYPDYDYWFNKFNFVPFGTLVSLSNKIMIRIMVKRGYKWNFDEDTFEFYKR